MIIEGIVPPIVRMDEGPFGDHFGHYSHQSPFPVFQAQTITQRAHPIYLSAVVGKPPQEDKYIGNAVQEITIPLLKVIHPELRDFWAHYEAGFHSLGVVSVEERYAKEGMKTALGLFGTGQMSLTKCLVVVDEDVNVRDMSAVLAALRAYFNPAEDFLLLPGVPFDTLDFTSMTLNVGSKMVLDATSKSTPQPLVDIQVTRDDLRSVDTRITSVHVLNNALVLVQVDGEGRSIIEQLVRHPRLQAARLVAVVSPDVDLDDRESWMWGLFTRFDPARDVIFADTTLQGSWPVYRGVMGIDATFKPGYPAPVEMHDEIVELVDRRWKEYQL
jgi:4-hydroxybenzoate decarboxylase subunit C